MQQAYQSKQTIPNATKDSGDIAGDESPLVVGPSSSIPHSPLNICNCSTKLPSGLDALDPIGQIHSAVGMAVWTLLHGQSMVELFGPSL
jgi:hypothetical protein